MQTTEDTTRPFKIRTNLGRYIVLQCKDKQHARERFQAECLRKHDPENILSIEKVV